MKKQKILVVLGTRPEAIKLAPVVLELRRRRQAFRCVLAITSQHREMLAPMLEFFGLAPKYDLDVMRPDQRLGELTGRILAGLDQVLETERPDWVVVQGDTTTAMAAGLAAFYRKIRLAHVEAGLRTNDKYSPFPEEINRRLVGALADLHFAPTADAARNLRREDDGLAQPWAGRVWLNPPYSNVHEWLAKMIEHGDGVALVNARPETQWFQGAVRAAVAVLWLRGRVDFKRPDGVATHPPVGSVLVAYGDRNAAALLASGLPGVVMTVRHCTPNVSVLGTRHLWRVPSNALFDVL